LCYFFFFNLFVLFLPTACIVGILLKKHCNLFYYFLKYLLATSIQTLVNPQLLKVKFLFNIVTKRESFHLILFDAFNHCPFLHISWVPIKRDKFKCKIYIVSIFQLNFFAPSFKIGDKRRIELN